MGILGRYITKGFILYFSSCLVSLVSIALTFVVLSELDSLDKPGGTELFIAAILAAIPLLVELILPIAVLLGTILTYTSLSKSSETIAMQAAGISITQLIKPVLLFGILIAGGAYFNQSYLAPWWGAEKKLGFTSPKPPLTIWRFYQGELYFFSDLDRNHQQAGNLGIVRFNKEHKISSISRVEDVSQAPPTWSQQVGKQISFSGDSLRFDPLAPKNIDQESMPIAFNPDLPHPKYTDFGSLVTEIQIKSKGAVTYADDLFALFQKIAGLISIFTMILLALPFSLFSGRAANVRTGMVVAIVLGFVYWLVDQVFASLFEAGALSAGVAAFGANGIFLSLAFFLIRQKLH